MDAFLGLNEDELQLFLDETSEHLDILESELIELESGGVESERIAHIFRSAHTIKGAAATVGLDGMANLTHAMETLFDRMRSDAGFAYGDVVSSLFEAVDYLRSALKAVVNQQRPDPPDPALLQALAEAAGSSAASGATDEHFPADAPEARDLQTKPVAAGDVPGSVRVEARFRDGCDMPDIRALQILKALEDLGAVRGCDPDRTAIEAEEVGERLTVWIDSDEELERIERAVRSVPEVVDVQVQAPSVESDETSKRTPAQSTGGTGAQEAETAVAAGVQEGKSTPATTTRGGEDRTIRVDVVVLDDLMNLVGELVIDRGRIVGLAQSLALRSGMQDIADELGRVTGHLARVSGSLQETVLKTRMLPIERVFKRFPRVVRDLAQQLGKQVDFRMSGEETELDRSLLEVIGDPLIHLVRNALDHGLESAEDRVSAGKPAVGSLQLIAAHEENHVLILIQDDGRGIDPEHVRAVAVRKGLLSAERAREIGDHEAVQLLFEPGFSTSEHVTDLSGRGVGLDVVRKNVEQVSGRVEVESTLGEGTTFRLLLPLTLATIRALLVKVKDETLALPLSAIAETLHVGPGQVSSVNGQWVTRVRGRVVPLLWLEQFVTPGFRPGRSEGDAFAVLVNHKRELIGLVVDELDGEQEVVVKGLGRYFGSVRGISGVTVLGDGSLGLILDITGLMGVLLEERDRDRG